MIQRVTIIGLVIFLAIFFQTAFVLIETIDRPHKTVISFCKAYYQLDDAAKKLVTESCRVQDEIDLIDQYFSAQKKIANDRGYRDQFLVNYLTNINTHIIKQTKDSAVVNIKAKRFAIIPWLRTRKTYDVDHTFSLTFQNNKWFISEGVANL
ncbi:conserved hypothetical protein, secreted [Candidatus Magnetomorum sp. HK-1]|nr:conserved hypothetical protein, secreted [Candidatus Magnetomorum sp. HK-1]